VRIRRRLRITARPVQCGSLWPLFSTLGKTRRKIALIGCCDSLGGEIHDFPEFLHTCCITMI
jgi:hypothetical protein